MCIHIVTVTCTHTVAHTGLTDECWIMSGIEKITQLPHKVEPLLLPPMSTEVLEGPKAPLGHHCSRHLPLSAIEQSIHGLTLEAKPSQA